MKDPKTTILGIAEAATLELAAESMFQMTWPQRAAIIGMAVLRASFGVLAADARTEQEPAQPVRKRGSRRVG